MDNKTKLELIKKEEDAIKKEAEEAVLDKIEKEKVTAFIIFSFIICKLYNLN